MAIAHRSVGNGPHTVFCLHGWFGSADGWGSFPDYLDGEKFTYVFTDNRGYGARKDEKGEYTLDEVADYVLALADDQAPAAEAAPAASQEATVPAKEAPATPAKDESK